MSSAIRPPVAGLPPQTCEHLVEEAPVGICLIRDGRIVYGNRWLRDFGGLDAVDHPLDVLAMIHPDDRAAVARQMQQRLCGGDAQPAFPARFVGHDGSVREVEVSARSVDYGGRPALHATLVDVTERVDAERSLRESAARLEESNRCRQLFSDILSHDLMSPVWIAENYLRLLADGGVPEAQRPFFEGIRGSLAKARGILTDARTYLRINDRVTAAFERVDLVPLVEATASALRPLWEEKGQTVVFTLAERAELMAGALLRELVWHLLSNAIKYGPPDTPIDVAVVVGPTVRLEVRDRGPGVAGEDREGIFQRFERLEKGAISGIGLGLAIARRVADLYGGRVWVDENPGGGSVFTAEFPAAGSAGSAGS